MTASAMHIAVGLLARRDYSRHQIKTKLLQKGFELSEIEPVLDRCIDNGFLDDDRFAALLLRSHVSKGHGQNRIRQSMAQKGLSKEVIERALNNSDCDWFELAKSKANKKFGETVISDAKDRARRCRYLYGQGFTSEQVFYALE
ncbi:regulatory protein RecX [Shewanella algidipiscicola]|uniref:Regulatory protein RecX n=1 Tax=Shewanella algidipiscicola TaxID=614070 RepID=A0ABQ4P8T3_9GAMM|nr:regulatory protein RecX [Shewanella algidipiscicola]